MKGSFLIFLRCFRTFAKTCQLGPRLHNSCKDSIFEVHLRNGKQLIRARSSWGVPGVPAFCKKCCATLRKASWGHSMNQSSDHLHWLSCYKPLVSHLSATYHLFQVAPPVLRQTSFFWAPYDGAAVDDSRKHPHSSSEGLWAWRCKVTHNLDN